MTKYALLLVLAASAGCAPATLQAAYLPNPVLLGPVDRIGGHRASREATLHTFEIEADGPITRSKETKEIGGEPQVTRRIVGTPLGQRAVTNALLGMTEGRSDRDVRVEKVAAGAYVQVIFNGVFVWIIPSRWVDVSGRVVQVRHAL